MTAKSIGKRADFFSLIGSLICLSAASVSIVFLTYHADYDRTKEAFRGEGSRPISARVSEPPDADWSGDTVRVAYSFTVDGQAYDGKLSCEAELASVLIDRGSTIVRYRTADPSQNRSQLDLDEMSDPETNVPLLLGLIALAAAMSILLPISNFRRQIATAKDQDLPPPRLQTLLARRALTVVATLAVITLLARALLL